MYGIAELDRPEWITDAACRGMGPGLFYDWETIPGRGERISDGSLAKARAVCATCPVQYECLAYALTTLDRIEVDHGVWGGTTPEQRVRLRRARRSA